MRTFEFITEEYDVEVDFDHTHFMGRNAVIFSFTVDGSLEPFEIKNSDIRKQISIQVQREVKDRLLDNITPRTKSFIFSVSHKFPNSIKFYDVKMVGIVSELLNSIGQWDFKKEERPDGIFYVWDRQ